MHRVLNVVFAILATLAAVGASAMPANLRELAATDSRIAPSALLCSIPIDRAPDDASTYRILYRSSGLHVERITVSGMVVVP